jgi:hypothetical protein
MTRWFYLSLLLLAGFGAVCAQNQPAIVTLTGTVLDQNAA